MFKNLVQKSGIFKSTLLLAIVATATSVVIYSAIGLLLGHFTSLGLLMTTLISVTVSFLFATATVKVFRKLNAAEIALRNTNTQLELRVQERTAEFVAANQNLRAEIEMRTTIEERLVTLLEEKKKLHKEINHRVKNNLQIVASLLNLQASMLADKKVRTILQDSQSRIRSLALIHEKLYQSGNMAQINFGEYVKDLTAYLLRTHQHRANDISLSVDDIWLDVDTAVSLGLVINELTSNAIEHAFPDGQIGTIRVSVRKTDPQTLELVISDNGVGLPEITPEMESTLGLQLVGSLANQLNGFLNISRKDGTSIKIRVPVKEHHHE